MNVEIAKVKIGPRFRRDLGSVESLAASIREVGLLHPVVLTKDGQLIAGKRRIEAAKLLEWTEIPATMIDLKEIVKGEFAENVARKDFTPSEAVAIAEELEPEIREQAKERQKNHSGTAPGRPAEENTSGKLPEVKGDARDHVAQFVGISGRTLDKAKAVVQAAREDPGKYGHLQKKMDSTGLVSGAFRQLQKERQAVKIESTAPPTGEYNVIVLDPPWAYEKRAGDFSQEGQTPYLTMTQEELLALPLPAASDCVLWLWTTNAHMHDAFHLLESWGFKQKTILTWAKNKIGLGDWLRGQTEHCLMAVKGNYTVRLTNESTLLGAPTRGHSTKPEEFFSMIEELCPGTKLEMFARGKRGGVWDSWGAEAE